MRQQRRPSFRQSDVKRALEAARKAGHNVAACVIGENGSIRLVFRNGAASAHALDDWDEVLVS